MKIYNDKKEKRREEKERKRIMRKCEEKRCSLYS